MAWDWNTYKELSISLQELAKKFGLVIVSRYGGKESRPNTKPPMVLIDFRGDLLTRQEELEQALGGMSGIGHFLQTSGRVDCPVCHHPQGRPWHFEDCRIGQVFAEKIKDIEEGARAAEDGRRGVP